MAYWFSPRILQFDQIDEVYSTFKYGNLVKLKIINLINKIYNLPFNFPNNYWSLIKRLDFHERAYFKAKIDVSEFEPRDLFPKDLIDTIVGFEKEAIDGYFSVIKGFDISYYDEYVTKYIYALNNLDKFCVDRRKMLSYTNNKMFKSCVPNRFLWNKKYHKFEYHLETLTGRSAIKSKTSFNIVKCPKNMKDFIVSKWRGGKIVTIDYSSMDVRSLMLYSGENFKGDLYDKLMKLTKIDVPRDVFKMLFLGLLYGANPSILSHKTGVSRGTLSILKGILSDMFGNVVDGSLEKNIFGRPIKVEQKKLLSYLGQSTSADICHKSLHDIVKICEENNTKTRPIGIIHDMILLDCHPDEDMIESIYYTMSKRKINGKEIIFPVKLGMV